MSNVSTTSNSEPDLADRDEATSQADDNFELESNAFPDEIGEPSGDSEFTRLIDQLDSIPISTTQDGDFWAEVREVLASLRLSRGVLLEVAEKADSTGSESAAQYVRAMEAYQNARGRLTEANLKLVFHLAQKFQYSGEPLGDLVQAGNIGLLKAVERYDWRRGFKFSTYATWWIRQSISRHVADSCRTIRIPVHVYEKLQRLLREISEFESTFHRPPRLSELEEHMKMPATKVEALHRLASDLIPIHEGFHDGLVAVDETESLAPQSPDEIVYSMELCREIDRLLATLDRRDAETVRLRFGIGVPDSLTLEEVGQRYGVTRERIRQIEAKSLRKLRLPTRGGVFAQQALGISMVSGKKATGADGKDDVLPGSAKGVTRGRKSRDSPDPVETGGSSSPPRLSRLDQLLSHAMGLGVPIEDQRESGDGTVWVNLVDLADSKHRQLARKLIDFGFEFWPRRGYWK